MDPNTTLQPGDIVQLSPTIKSRGFAACLAVVSETKTFGAQVYVQGLGAVDEPGGQAYIRVKWEDMELTGGRAVWVPP